MEDLLAMAGKEWNVEEARVALHFAIITANEMGQPKGQELGTSSSSSASSSSSSNKSIVSMIHIYFDYRYRQYDFELYCIMVVC